MTTITAGASATLTLGPGDSVAVTSQPNAEGTVTVTQNGPSNAGSSTTTTPSVSHFGPPAINKTFGPYALGATVVIVCSLGSIDYTLTPVSVGGATKARLPKTLPFARSVMASPPTPTLTGSHTISSPIYWEATNQFVFTGGNFTYSKAGSPVIGSNAFLAKFTSVNYGGAGPSANVEEWSCITYGDAIEFHLFGHQQNIWIKINDQYVSLTPLTAANDGGEYYLYIPFGSVATRRVSILISGSTGVFAGAYTGPTYSLEPAQNRGSSVVWIGDSFTEGSSGSTYGTGESSVVLWADAMGWDNVMVSGVGSTGFLANPGGKLNYRQRFSTDLYPFNPDYVIFQVSQNDASFTLAQLQAEWALVLAAVKANCPNAIICFCGIWCNKGPGWTVPGMWQISDAAKAFCAANNILWFSASDQALQPGVTPLASALAASAALNATSISTTVRLTGGETYRFADGTRFKCVSCSGGGPFTVVIDNLLGAQASGAVITQTGRSLWSGHGYTGATQGDGNCDTLVAADQTHPTSAGQKALAVVNGAEFLLVAAR